MNSRKIKVLGVAPYKGMEKIMINLAKERDDLELTTIVSDISFSTEKLSKHLSENYDVIISRGGTAEFLKSITNIPIVEINISVYDILRAIKIGQNFRQDYAIVGFPAITSTAHTLSNLLQSKIDIVTVANKDEVYNILVALKNRGNNVIICDTITNNVAKEIGLTPILIASGLESISEAFDQCVKIYSDHTNIQEMNYVLTKILESQNMDTIVMKKDGTIYFSTYKSNNSRIIINYLSELILNSKNNLFEKSFHLIENILYSISLNKIKVNNNELFVFSIKNNPISLNSNKYGIRFSNCNEMKDRYYKSFYNLILSSLDLNEKIKQINITNNPLIILGEKGTGKDMLAAKLYFESSYSSNPYIIINCELLNDKSWNYLINSYNSPFCDNNNTIFISNLHALSTLQRKQLLTLIIDTSLHIRNRIIFSCSQTLENKHEDPSREFIEHLSCFTLYLPPLRQLKHNLLSSCTLYLNTLNMEFSKSVVGFEDRAIEMLESYYWPQNVLQLNRVLRELVILTDTSYIKLETVKNTLSKEDQQFANVNNRNFDINFNYNKSLNEIVKDVIHIVLSKCNGNQSQAAKELGISRTTLWRYLK